MTDQLYPQGKNHLLGKSAQINVLTDTLKVMFYAGTYSGTHEYVSDLTGASIVARSGALSGQVLSSGTFDANDITLVSVSGSAFSGVIMYKDSGADASSPLTAWWDVTTFTPTGGSVTVVFNASGIFGI